MMARLAALLALLSALLAPAAMAAGDGSLTRVGCLSLASQPGCGKARAIGDPGGVAVSPGGRSVYVASARSDAVAVFRRNRRTGRLQQLRGRAGCVRHRGGRRCRRGEAMRDPFAVVVSPDGRNVYVAALGSQTIGVFRRNRRTGALRHLVRRALDGVSSLALSPDGRFLYAGTSDGVAAFRRTARTGGLVPLNAAGGGPTQVGDVAVDAVGEHLYASSPGAKGVTVFDLEDGVPSRIAGCISDAGEGGCTAGRTLNGAFGLALSPEGGQLYTAAEFSGAVASLARDQASGTLSQPAGPLGCIRDGGGLGCAEARFMGHPDLIEASKDGRNVYVRAEGGDLVVLRRDRATGALTQLPGRRGCISARNAACTGSGGQHVGAMALSGDGRNVYLTSESNLPGGVISIYRRAR